uniref:Uncharacterized protein n=1 Tax=Zea mays TaxID=4577 RepID=B6U2L4_MAIZE|nr:hypothetical protein [Zea mays]
MMLGAGALTNPPLLPFDGFTDEDFLASADAALLGEAGTDQTLLLLPSCPGANCCGGSSSDQGLEGSRRRVRGRRERPGARSAGQGRSRCRGP